jgi:hypothetical protein
MPDTLSGPADEDPDLIEAGKLYVALSFLDDAARMGRFSPLALSDLVAFLSGNLVLSDAQQDFLFSNERMLTEFRSLVRGFSSRRLNQEGQSRKQDDPDNLVHLPLRAAASGGTRDSLIPWIVDGSAWMRVHDFGETEVLLSFTFHGSWVQTPRLLLLEQRDAHRVGIISLTNPVRSFASGINIVVPRQSREFGMTQDTNCIGTFLQ